MLMLQICINTRLLIHHIMLEPAICMEVTHVAVYESTNIIITTHGYGRGENHNILLRLKKRTDSNSNIATRLTVFNFIIAKSLLKINLFKLL